MPGQTGSDKCDSVSCHYKLFIELLLKIAKDRSVLGGHIVSDFTAIDRKTVVYLCDILTKDLVVLTFRSNMRFKTESGATPRIFCNWSLSGNHK